MASLVGTGTHARISECGLWSNSRPVRNSIGETSDGTGLRGALTGQSEPNVISIFPSFHHTPPFMLSPASQADRAFAQMLARKSATAATGILKRPAANRTQPPPGRSTLFYISLAGSRAAAAAAAADSCPRRPLPSHPHHRHHHQQQRSFRATPAAKMHENVAKLYPNPETSAKVMDYSVAHSTPLPEYLTKYHAWGAAETKVPDYLISTFQAQMLIFLARIVGAKKGKAQCYPLPSPLCFNCALTKEQKQSSRSASTSASPAWSGPRPSARAAASSGWS